MFITYLKFQAYLPNHFEKYDVIKYPKRALNKPKEDLLDRSINRRSLHNRKINGFLSDGTSATRLLDYFSTFGHLHQCKFAQK